MRIAVLGAGAWGTALAVGLSAAHGITLWARNPAQAAEMAAGRRNDRYLSGAVLPAAVTVEADLAGALQEADFALAVVPMSGLRQLLREISACAAPIPLVWACKGFESGSMKMPHQVVAEELPAGHPSGVLSGPSFAAEVAAGLPTAVTLASDDEAFAHDLAAGLNSPRLRIYSSNDVVGVEVGGAVKNVMAIAAGISDGMGFGHNARAALITRGLAEITRLGTELGGRHETFFGLSGVGDLILTCTGDLSRNRTVGLKLGGGEGLERILRELGHVAEGVATAREVHKLARRMQVEMPITHAVYRVLYEGLPPKAAVEELLNRQPKAENGRERP